MPRWKCVVVGACVSVSGIAIGITELGWKWAFFCVPLDIALLLVGSR